jgi:hypothetical protein
LVFLAAVEITVSGKEGLAPVSPTDLHLDDPIDPKEIGPDGGNIETLFLNLI